MKNNQQQNDNAMEAKKNTSVLIVEDEAIIAEDLKRIVSGFGYVVVGVAYDCNTAVKLALGGKPDIILMDINLRGEMDGIEVVARISEEIAIPTIFTTGNADEKLLGMIDHRLAYGYLIKPFTENELCTALTIAHYKIQKDVEVRNLNSLLNSLLNISRLITIEKKPGKLLQGACDNLIKTSDYCCVTAIHIDVNHDFLTAKFAGTLKNKQNVQVQLGNGIFGNCLLKAMEQKEVYIHDELDLICEGCPMRLLDHDKSSMTVGLHHAGKCYGVICISVPRDHPITNEEVELIRGIGSDIAYALKNIELQKKRKIITTKLQTANGIINASPAIAFIWRDEEGRPIEYVSQNVSSLFEYSRAEVLKNEMKYGDLIHPDDLQRVIEEAALNQIGSSQKLATKMRYRVRTKSGQIKWVEDRTTLVLNKEGEVKRYQGIIIDITEEVESKDRHLKLAMAINEIKEGIVITDVDGNIEYVNKGFENITQYKFNEVQKKNPRILRSGKNDPEIYDILWKTILAGKSWSGNLTNRRKDGSEYIDNMTIVPLKNEQGELVNFIAIKRDISEKLLMERELRQAQKLESIGQLAAGVAHEINTPIQYIGDNIRFLNSSFSDILHIIEQYEDFPSSGDPERITQFLNSVETSKDEMDISFLKVEIPESIQQSLEGVENITRIVRAMKEFSHPGINEMTRTDINGCITTTIAVAKNEWKYYAEMITDLCAELPSTLCLPGELNQVLLNLITNAAQALSETQRIKQGGKGTITITTSVIDDQIVISVTDDGPGIPKKLQHRVFDPFFTTKDPGKGTGQGLTISHNTIVEKLHGEIYFETEPSKGTTFIIKLPILQNIEVEDEN